MRRLAAICVHRPVFATMIVMMLMVLGVDGYRKLGVDLFPKVELPTVTVTTTLRGASPEEVESQVTKRIEEAVNTVSGIDELKSTSSEGVSLVMIQFVLEKDQDEAAQEVRDKISRVIGQLPKDADPPVTEKLATDATPVINIVVASNRDLRETTKIVDDRIKKNLESLNGVGQVRFVGDRQRQIQVILDGERLYAYNLNIDQIRQQLALQNVEVPGGNIDQGRREVSLRTLGRVERPQDFERIIVGSRAGQPVRVTDVGRVIDGFEEPRSLARLDGRPAVALEVRKQSGTNTLDVIKAIKARMNDLRPTLPHDLEITYTRDQSVFIQESFNAVQEHLILGSIFAALVVMVFIRDWRSTLIASVAIPTSIISTYTLINAMGFTLNNITMLALTLMVGIVIDDAIVVLENIFKFMEEKHMGPVQAAIEGTRDIGLAVMATTFSLVIIFLPIAFMGGIVGRFMSSFGYTAAFAILVSMLVSFTMTPMLCSRFLKQEPSEKGAGSKDTFLFRWMASFYRVCLHWSMTHRWVIVILSVGIVISTGPLFMRIGKDFLSSDDQSEFEVSVKTPPGSSLEGSDAVFRELEKELRTLPGVRNLYTSIGSDMRKQVDRGSVLVELVPPKQRKESQAELIIKARAIAMRHRDLTTSVQPPAVFSGAVDRELMFFLQGPDLNTLNRYATEIRDRLAREGSTVDLESSYEAGKPEVRVLVNRDKAASLNVSVASIATALRTLVGGDEQATTYRENDDRYDVMLRVDKQFRSSQGSLNRLFVPSLSLGNVPVASVAALQDSTGPVQIERYNRQRQIMITGNVAKGRALSDVITLINSTVASMNLPPEYRTGYTGKSKELGRAGAAFAIALLLSILFMYMILAAQFESFIDPITILLSLPLSVPFALLALLFFRENYSIIYSSVGVLVLFGIVKKNSILQIDHIKNLRRDGTPRMEAILHGCEDRLRPILLTTAALVAGMIPLAVGSGAGAGTRRTVAIVVIGGQTMALLLTLLVTPVAYSLFDDLANMRIFSRLFGLFRRPAAATTSLVLALALLAAPGAQAQTVVTGAFYKLSLPDAVQMALRSNLEIEIEKTNVASAYEFIRGSRGYLDPNFRYAPTLESRNTPTSSTLASPTGKLTESFIGQNFYFRQRTNWSGLSFHADFENTRQTTNNPFVSLTPYITPRLTIGATLPLLRDRKIDNERATLIIRRKQASSSDVDFQIRVIDVIARVEQAYYDLVAVRADFEVAAESVALAQEQYDRTKRMIDSGTIAPVELFAAEAELNRRKDNLYASENLRTQVENTLKQLITGERESDLWRSSLWPTSDQRAPHPSALNDNLRTLLDAALRKRPELRALTLRGEANQTQKEQALNQKKIQLNATANYISTGLAGSTLPASATNPFTQLNAAIVDRLNTLSKPVNLPPLVIASGSVPGALIGGYGQSLSNLFGASYSTFQGGVTLDWTIHNHAAESSLAQTAITERRLALERRRAEQTIEVQVRNALQAIHTSEQRIAAAESSARAAKEKLDSETRLYQTGESTNFLVLTRQNEFSDSRRRAVVSTLEYNKSIARFLFSLGQTLDTYSIQLK
ncbi:MAG: efflux RND transporter permease subunit [Acidobacteria bacterium]|nr:efflux RND transporter permease subunit [Acidobacteriota bacterium]